MYLTIRHYRVPPSKMAEVVRRVDEVWLDRLSKLEGFETAGPSGGGTGERLAAAGSVPGGTGGSPRRPSGS